MPIIILLVTVVLTVFWCYQFIFLMMMEDDLFPGKQDKLIWGLVFALAAPLAPFAFLFWRRAVLSLRKGGNDTRSEH